MILVMKRLPDGRWACLNQPQAGAHVSVELDDHVERFDSFTFDDPDDARRVFDALPAAEVHEEPVPATDEVGQPS